MRERFGERVAELVEALTDDESIEPYERAQGRAPRAGRGGRAEALAIYAADKLTNVAMLREAYASEGEEVGEELKVPLDVKVDVWEADLEMLRDEAPRACRFARRARRPSSARSRAIASSGGPAPAVER